MIDAVSTNGTSHIMLPQYEDDLILDVSGQETFSPSEPRSIATSAGQAVSEHLASNDFSLLKTDRGGALCFLSLYGDNVRYCKGLGGWQVWSEKRWEQDETQRVEYLVKEAMTQWYKAADASRNPCVNELADWTAKGLNQNRIRPLLKSAISEPGVSVPIDAFDQHAWLLNCENGTLDLRTGELRPHRREDFMTKLAPVSYDAEASCPRWIAFLKRIFADDQELIRYVQRVVGYSLTGSTREQCLFLLHGTGQNGKTKFVQILMDMLGDYATSSNFYAFTAGSSISEKRAAVCQLPGARLVSASESAPGCRLDEPMIKQLSGEDPIKGRLLYNEEFGFYPQLKLYLVTNHLPSIGAGDFAMWRRIKLIPFNVRIPDHERDNELINKLRQELPGILAWAVAGCLDWKANGLAEPETVKQAIAGYMREQDTIGRFMDESCVFNPRTTVGLNELRKAYEDWCESSGEIAANTREFAKYLSGKAGLSKTRFTSGPHKGRTGWTGIGLA